MMRPSAGQARDSRFWDRDIETIQRKKLARLQEERLREQLEYVYRHSPFYRDKFSAEKFHPEDFKSMEDIWRIPRTRKDELRLAILQRENPLPHLCVAIDEIAGFGCSRGTTGMPTFSAFTQEDIDQRVECYMRSFCQLGFLERDLCHAMIGIQSITQFIFREAARRLGIGYINDGVHNPANSVQIGRWLKPNILFTGIKTLFEMEKILEAEGLLPKDAFTYERIILYGDVISKHLIEHVEEKWGVERVFSLGGSAADLLWYNFSCHHEAGNHCLNEDMFLVEVLHPGTGLPVRSGEKGELVVTDLCSKGAPHIRWNMEDLVIPFYEPCKCGRTHVRLKYLGRSLYEVRIKGKEIFPVEIEHHLWHLNELERAEFRIVKYAKNMDYLKLEVEVDQDKQDNQLKEKIMNYLEGKLGIDVSVRFVSPGELPVRDIKTPRVLDLTKS